MCYEMLSCLVTESEEYKIGKSIYYRQLLYFIKKTAFGSRGPLAFLVTLNIDVQEALDTEKQKHRK